MDRAEAEGNITADVVSKVSDDICKVLKQSATASGPSHEVKVSAKKPRRRALPHKPWYNTECEEARRNMLKYGNKWRRLKNATHFNAVYSKQYKKTVNKAFREYKKATINKLRTLQSENPKEYWDIIQGETKQVNETKISLDIFVQHFKLAKLASETESTNQTEACHREELNVADDPDLNKPFNTQEIIKAIKKLKSHKSSGIDQIINDFFKHSPDKLLPVYANLFNIILSAGIVPDDWAISIVRPIYKNKGDDTDPNNYRGIYLLSCFGKLFTSCLNERLSNFVKAHDTVGPELAGFKSDNSTIDHIFVLKILADIYLNKRKRLYCFFVDYQKAFDTINRTKLYNKLLSSGISGRILKVIKNLYSQAKSCVNVSGKNISHVMLEFDKEEIYLRCYFLST